MKTKINNIIQEEIESLKNKIKEYEEYEFDESKIMYRCGYYDSYENERECESHFNNYDEAEKYLVNRHRQGNYLESFVEICNESL